MFIEDEKKLIMKFGESTLVIEPWGINSLRVRMTKEPTFDPRNFALTEEIETTNPTIHIEKIDVVEPWYHGKAKESHTQHLSIASIQNGKIIAKINYEGWLQFEDENGNILLKEYWRNRNRIDRYSLPTRIDARELKPIPGTNAYELAMRFEADDEEKIYGLGQYQDKYLNRKGSTLELCHRNSQASVPFLVSSKGYGFLWNNPAIGEVTFSQNITEWTAKSTQKLDYYITVGDTPKQILEQYTKATGRVPMMPEYGLGLWQCKLRYRNQEELLNVVHEYKRRNLPLDVIVIDFFHWTKQGEYKFDPVDWPDPEAMIAELKSCGVELMISVWPTIDTSASTASEMFEQGYLVNVDRGPRIHMNWMGETVFFDATNPKAQSYVWQQCKKNYYDKGVKLFWLDEAEPEYGPYDFDIFRYHEGPALQVSNLYPVGYAKGFYDGMKEAGQENIVNLIRCGWAGSQKYGALVWSGDISSTFRAMQEQLQIGLNMGLAGIPWWTSDIGGFVGGDITNPEFKELLVRWFEWAVFTPILRMHGERQPFYELDEEYRNNVKQFSSGQDNELWSFGEENYEILKAYLLLRESLRPYIRNCMKEAHETGSPIMRTMFFEFPEDQKCWELSNQYMFGSDLLIAPVTKKGMLSRDVYLPCNSEWTNIYTKETYFGGTTIHVPTPINQIPVFVRNQSKVLDCFKEFLSK